MPVGLIVGPEAVEIVLLLLSWGVDVGSLIAEAGTAPPGADSADTFGPAAGVSLVAESPWTEAVAISWRGGTACRGGNLLTPRLGENPPLQSWQTVAAGSLGEVERSGQSPARGQ